MSEVELPQEVTAFLLVGRIVEKVVERTKKRGVVKYLWSKFGKGGQHDGLPCYYPPAKQGAKVGNPMDTDFKYAVFWEDGSDEDYIGLEELRLIVTNEWTQEPWLPEAIRKLHKEGWAAEWDQLTGDNAHTYLLKVRNAAKGAANKANKRPGSAAGRPSKPAKAAAAKLKTGKKDEEKQPLGKFSADSGARLEASVLARREAKKRQAAAGAAASGETGSPPQKKSRLASVLGNPPHGSVAVPAAAAAAVVPSSGHDSPAEEQRDEVCGDVDAGLAMAGPPAKRQTKVVAKKSQQKKQLERESESCIAGTSGKQQVTGKDKGKGKAAVESGAAAAVPAGRSKGKEAAGKAATGKGKGKALASATAKAPASGSGKVVGGSKGKQTLVSPSKSALSSGSGSGSGPEVLQQHKQEPVPPAASERLQRLGDEWEGDCDTLKVEADGSTVNVHWFDLVKANDGRLYRVWSQSLIVADALCFKPKCDKRLRTWKLNPPQGDEEEEYAVEALLAEREDEDGQVSYFVKFRGYEVDPTADGWLLMQDMSNCREVLQEWQRKGRDAWLKACQSLLKEGGLV